MPDAAPQQLPKLGKGFVVLLPVGELLRGDDVIERGELDHDSVDSTWNGSSDQLVVGLDARP